MRNSGMTKTAWMLATGFILALAGCSDAQKQDWNEFWGVNSGPKRGVKSSPKQQRTETRKASAERPATKETRPADAPDEDGGNPENVDKDINAYSAQMNPAARNGQSAQRSQFENSSPARSRAAKAHSGCGRKGTRCRSTGRFGRARRGLEAIRRQYRRQNRGRKD
ncbi:MAG: hypothetical protein IPK83_06170 [Planctomycetes bacterium]|nr:hypothetical protein [Planctomycetota bacterium]